MKWFRGCQSYGAGVQWHRYFAPKTDIGVGFDLALLQESVCDDRAGGKAKGRATQGGRSVAHDGRVPF